ncbi:FAD-dependent oxidoreductase [bacterium]|nr:FAD-dependent oxidoreductase [bacterium]
MLSSATDRELSCDVLVAGGGMAGVSCALAAARNGANVILCQDRPVLGGNASSEVRMHILGAEAHGRRGAPLAVEAREGGILEEIRLETCVSNPQRSASMLDLVLYDLCRREPRLTLLLNTTVTGVEKSGRLVTHALARRESTEDHFRIAARVFVDCTGDGRLALEAGASFRRGRESRHEYGESLAGAHADSYGQGSSLLFQARRHDRPMAFTPPAWARKFTEEDLRLRPHATGPSDLGEYGFCGLEFGYWWIEWGGHLDVIKDNATIRDELLAIVLGVWDHIKNGGDHGAENWALEWFGFLPGKRESRRFVGQHTLTQDEIVTSAAFPDAIAYGGWSIDDHPPKGIDAPDEHPGILHVTPHLYSIPLRCCVSRDVDNLMFAGRNISASHLAFAAIRLMGTCSVVGQGVGTAAACAVHRGLLPSQLCGDADALRRIQQQLLRDDAYLICVVNESPRDRARQASLCASSWQADGPAANVVTGQTRSVHGERGAPPERARPGTHRWMSDPLRPLPAWLELRWERPVRPAEVQLVFDTGMHRMLTLTHQDSLQAKMIWGRPQPETVRDYTLEGERNGVWTALCEVRGNYQRRRVHVLDDAKPVDALRVVVHATNGIDHARIVEVRVYEKAGGSELR